MAAGCIGLQVPMHAFVRAIVLGRSGAVEPDLVLLGLASFCVGPPWSEARVQQPHQPSPSINTQRYTRHCRPNPNNS